MEDFSQQHSLNDDKILLHTARPKCGEREFLPRVVYSEHECIDNQSINQPIFIVRTRQNKK